MNKHGQYIYSATPFSLLPSQSSPWEDFVCMDQDSVHRFDHCLICSETVLTNSMSRSWQKSHRNLNHHLWNWRLFTRSLKMAVAPKPNEIFHLMNGRDHFSSCSSTALKLYRCSTTVFLEINFAGLTFAPRSKKPYWLANSWCVIMISAERRVVAETLWKFSENRLFYFFFSLFIPFCRS